MLLEKEKFVNEIWEPACGENHITKVLCKHGHKVKTSDIIDRVGDGTIEIIDFLNGTTDDSFKDMDIDIITNPPYKYAQQFVEKAMDCVGEGHKVAMYLRLSFLEGKKRRGMFRKYQPKVVYVASGRMGCAKNGKFTDEENQYEAGAVAFAWFVWEKGYTGDTKLDWFNDQ